MIDAKEAERLARSFVAAQFKFVLCEEVPEGLYAARPDKDFYFLVHPAQPMQVGASRVIAVDRVTGAVRSPGFIGE